MRDCIFATVKCCSNPSNPSLVPITDKRIASIKNASKRRKDGLHMKIENEKYHCHLPCVKSYTSEQHIAKHLKRELPFTDECPEAKKTRRSLDSFNFKVHCLFCGKYCNVEPDKKNPSRWRPAYRVRTVDPKNPYKKLILDVCAQRGDAQADAVSVRVNGAIADLHSAEARYHDDCRKSFMNECCVNYDDVCPC